MMRRLTASALLIFLLVGQVSAQTLTSPFVWSTRITGTSTTATTINAAGEGADLVGYLVIQDGSSSKVCSAAGGCEILFATASGNTFANGSTSVDLGLEDPNTGTGLVPDTFDVSATLVGGTDTITNSTIHRIPMETGTKTVTPGQFLAIQFEMTARGGADVLALDTVIGATGGVPYSVLDTGSSAKTTNLVAAMIVFDDGSLGWIDQAPLSNNTNEVGDAACNAPTFNVDCVSFGTGGQTHPSVTTNDEFGGVFTLPVSMLLNGFAMRIGFTASADTYEFNLYETPSGTPAVLNGHTYAIDPDATAVPSSDEEVVSVTMTSAQCLEAGTEYAIAVRATSANVLSTYFFNLGSGNEDLKDVQNFSSIVFAARDDQSGAFVATQTYHIPELRLQFSGLCGANAGGGERSHVFVQ